MGYIMDLRKVVGSRPLILVGSCVLVKAGNTILLAKRTDNGMWGFPGGSLELGESMEEVAQRELFEETGIQAQKLNLLDVFSGQELYYKYPHGDEVYNVVAAYVCDQFGGEVVQDHREVSEIQFFEIDSLPSEISPPDRPIIKSFLNRIHGS